ncbi:HMG-Y-related protein A-like [Impatiens glandulifera]|uniref:HMG-Y-related protein A-like n=1 Tax=Impatiens glandulifera TaxID=253017 RepID=UPI001FB1A036|nr:HMG-Y-related protein A-like [Impatiens glandulifera]
MSSDEIASPPSTLPPYPEMIFEAIDSLKEKEGSNKTSISKYIESTYASDLPPAHSHATLLLHHLTKMKDGGDLVFAKNNYARFDPTSPPKRGRGRPPKSKDQSSASASESAIKPASTRPRGRPKKNPDAPPPAKKAAVAPEVTKTGRPRGRPSKSKPQQAQAGVEAS